MVMAISNIRLIPLVLILRLRLRMPRLFGAWKTLNGLIRSGWTSNGARIAFIRLSTFMKCTPVLGVATLTVAPIPLRNWQTAWFLMLRKWATPILKWCHSWIIRWMLLGVIRLRVTMRSVAATGPWKSSRTSLTKPTKRASGSSWTGCLVTSAVMPMPWLTMTGRQPSNIKTSTAPTT